MCLVYRCVGFWELVCQALDWRLQADARFQNLSSGRLTLRFIFYLRAAGGRGTTRVPVMPQCSPHKRGAPKTSRHDAVAIEDEGMGRAIGISGNVEGGRSSGAVKRIGLNLDRHCELGAADEFMSGAVGAGFNELRGAWPSTVVMRP